MGWVTKLKIVVTILATSRVIQVQVKTSLIGLMTDEHGPIKICKQMDTPMQLQLDHSYSYSMTRYCLCAPESVSYGICQALLC